MQSKSLSSSFFKIPVFSAMLIVFSLNLQAQEDNTSFWEHVRFGGGIGLNFGDGFFNGTLAPSALYEINDNIGVGLGLNGTYSSIKNRDGEKFKASILGASVFSVFNPIDAVQLSLEFEELHVNRTIEFMDGDVKDRYWVPALFVGLGYRVNNFTFGMRYDLIYDDDKSVYSNAWMPFIRVFF